MTGVVVVRGRYATHLIADSIVTDPTSRAVAPTLLSSGLVVEPHRVMRVSFKEDALKIARVGPNLAVGFAGSANMAFGIMLEAKAFCAGQIVDPEAWRTYVSTALQRFIREHVGKHIIRCCGFLCRSDRSTVLFDFGYDGQRDNWHYIGDDSEGPGHFAIGSGANLLGSFWKNLRPNLPAEIGISMEFAQIAHRLYLGEFYGRSSWLFDHFTGGGVTGLFTTGEAIEWQRSTTTIVLQNVGGAGLAQKWVWPGRRFYNVQPYADGVVFAQATYVDVEGEAMTDLRFTRVANPLSLPADQHAFIRDFSFSAATHTYSYWIADSSTCGDPQRFPQARIDTPTDEVRPIVDGLISNGQRFIEFSQAWQNKMSRTMWVTDDLRVIWKQEAIEAHIQAVTDALATCSRERDVLRWATLKDRLGMMQQLVVFLSRRDTLLERSLENLLDAWEVSRDNPNEMQVDDWREGNIGRLQDALDKYPRGLSVDLWRPIYERHRERIEAFKAAHPEPDG